MYEPSIDQRGTPWVMGSMLEEMLFTDTYCLRHDRYEWNHSRALPCTPHLESLFKLVA